jgi:large subunit ribosomal protein L10
VLLAKMAGAMKASLNNAAYLFAAPLAQAARVVDALRSKKAAEGDGADTGQQTPAAEATEG